MLESLFNKIYLKKSFFRVKFAKFSKILFYRTSPVAASVDFRF